jgi:Mg2+/citrate symporter
LGTTGSVSTLIDVPALLPGNRLAVSTTVKGVLAEFLMAAKVTISPLPIAGDVNPPTQDAVATTRFWAIPWIPAAVVIILLLGMLALLLIRRKRRRAGNGRHSGLSTTKPVPEKVA